MNAKKLLLCSLCCSAFAIGAAQAQTGGNAGAPGSMASAPRGELSTPNQDKGGGPRGAAATSNTSREAVKADTAMSRGSASMPKGGELSTPNQDKGGGPRAAASGAGKHKAKHHRRHGASSASAMSSPTTPTDPAVTRGERTPPEQRKDTPRP